MTNKIKSALIAAAALFVLAGTSSAYFAKANFAYSYLGSSLSDAGPTLSVNAGTGVRFPDAGTFRVVINSSTCANASTCATREILSIAKSSVDIFTIVAREQESTVSPSSWPIGSKIEMTVTAGLFTELESAIDTKATSSTVQSRVTGSCPAGAISAISSDGTVTCSVSSSSTWSAITGTISDNAALQSALDSKGSQTTGAGPCIDGTVGGVHGCYNSMTFSVFNSPGGVALPATCNLHDVFFLDTAAPGKHWQACVSPNVWEPQDGVGASSSSAYALLLHMEGANGSTVITDQSYTPKTVTVIGGVHIDTSQYAVGTASAGGFAVGNNALSLATTTDINLNGVNSTIDLRYRMTSLPPNNSYGHVLMSRVDNTTAGWFLWLTQDSGVQHVNLAKGGGGAQINAAWTPSTNTWYDFTVKTVSGVTTLYVDLVSKGTTTDTWADKAEPLYIGRWKYDTNYNAVGNIDEVIITKP